ncbi:hypothetical protein [Novosphingobium sp. M1R2S20]|uniref:Uncharacterized protein n=1 Tax=Novosphingobium rhizovicinum TaxID=3228928 RepID=A0ABV3R8R7_9SPHN
MSLAEEEEFAVIQLRCEALTPATASATPDMISVRRSISGV